MKKDPNPHDKSNDADETFSLTTQRLAKICKALGHPARIAIIAHLQELNQCVCGQLVDALPLAQSTVSQHLKILKASGVVQGEIEGPRTCYCLNDQVLDEFKALIMQL